MQNNTGKMEKRYVQLALKLIYNRATAKEYSYSIHEKVTQDFLPWKASECKIEAGR